MEEKRKGVYTRKVTVRFKEVEYKYLDIQFKKSTCRKFSNYLRKVLLQQPVVITYRNASADVFLSEMIGLKKELAALGNNFNQAVKRLYRLELLSEIKHWIELNEPLKNDFLKKAEEIRSRLHQLYEQWLQK